jgi:hypothetical protein
MVVELLRTVSSTYTFEQNNLHYLSHPAFILSLIFIVAGSYWAVKKGQHLPVWMVLGGLAVMPWINHRYDFYISTRYIMPVVLCAILLMAWAVIYSVKLLISNIRQPRAIIIPTGALLLICMIGQLSVFYQYCNRVDSTTLSNRQALQIMSIVQKNYRTANSIILVDKNLQIPNQPIPYLLTESRIDYKVIATKAGQQKVYNKSQWLHALQHYQHKSVIAIMNKPDYLSLKKYLTQDRIVTVGTKVIMPDSKPYQQKIYIVEPKGNSLAIEKTSNVKNSFS